MMLNSLLFPKSLWSTNPIPTGCVLYLPLWHPALSGPVFKSIDLNHTCTVTGTTWGATGRIFDGDDDISCGTNSVLNFTSGAFSLEAWIKPTDLTAHSTIFVRGLSVTDGYFLSALNNGRVYFVTWQSGVTQASYTAVDVIAINTWYHVVLTRNGAAALVYVNGSPSALEQAATHINPTTSARNFRIGQRDDNSEHFIGIIGEGRVYNRVLSAGEVLHNYNNTKWRYV